MVLWLTFPPLISIPISVFLIAFAKDANRMPIEGPLWLLLLILYLSLSLVYAYNINRRRSFPLMPLQLAAQGIIICIISLEAGSPFMVPWLGVAIAASGFVSLANQFIGQLKGPPRTPAQIQEVEHLEDALAPPTDSSPFPMLSANREGTIIEANSAFKELSGDKAPEGKSVSEFFNPGNSEGSIGGKTLLIFQKTKDGLFYFSMMDPIKKGVGKNSAASRLVELFDSVTGLYSKEYASIRGPEEIGRAARYRRWLCGIYLKVSYVDLPGMDGSPDLEKAFFMAYLEYVKSEIRDSDMGFYLGGQEVLLLLPETSQQGAKDSALRLVSLPDELEEMRVDLPFSVDIEYGLIYYSGTHPLAFEDFIQKLQDSLGGASET